MYDVCPFAPAAKRRCYCVDKLLVVQVSMPSCHDPQHFLRVKRVWMRGAEDLPPLLDHVPKDSLGFEQVVACVVIKNASRRCRASLEGGAVFIQTRRVPV